MQYAGGGCKCYHRLRYHPSRFPEDVDLKSVVALAYGDSMKPEV